jgi:lipase ATG15
VLTSTLCKATTKGCLPSTRSLLPTNTMLLASPLTNILLPLLHKFFPADIAQHPHARPLSDNALSFQMRHMHAVASSAQVYFKDVPPEPLSVNGIAYPPAVSIPTSPMRTSRAPSLHEFTAARHMSKHGGQSAILNWQEDEVPGPDVTRRETLLLLAKMTSNSYFVPEHSQWYNLTDEWNLVRCLLSL